LNRDSIAEFEQLEKEVSKNIPKESKPKSPKIAPAQYKE
jgi:hypothetical protein